MGCPRSCSNRGRSLNSNPFDLWGDDEHLPASPQSDRLQRMCQEPPPFLYSALIMGVRIHDKGHIMLAAN